jgi:hypothetical protein
VSRSIGQPIAGFGVGTFAGVLLQHLSAPLVIAISGLACILAGLGGLLSPSLRQLQRESS